MIKVNHGGKITATKSSLKFPNLIDQGRKYGLSEEQISQLSRYLNDKRMLRIISLESFNRNARAWLSALTGIVANVLAADAHISIWLDKKTEKTRNWILSKLNEVIPTKIDDIAIRVLQTAQNFMDDKVLPEKERIFSKLNDTMHDKYNYHSNATYLGQSLKDLKAIARENLQNSSKVAKSDALKDLNNRKFQAAIMNGYYDSDGNFVSVKKYGRNLDNVLGKLSKERKLNNDKQENQKQQEISKEEVP